MKKKKKTRFQGEKLFFLFTFLFPLISILLTFITIDIRNETNVVVFGMSVLYIYRSLSFKKNGFFLSAYDFFLFFLIFKCL